MAAPASYEDLARLIDHTLLARDLTDTQIAEGCALANQYGVAAVVVRPCDIDVAVRLLDGGSVTPASVCGYPYGDQNTGVKLYELRDLLRRGAKEIEVTLNVSKLLGRQFPHVETELLQMAESCHKEDAVLKVSLDTAFLTDELRTIACRICSRIEADFVCAAEFSSGLVQSMRPVIHEDTGIKVNVNTLDLALEASNIGCARLGISSTAAILDAWKARLAAAAQPPQTVSA